MNISCDTCPVRGLRCGDCMMTVFSSIPVRGVEFDGEDERVLDILCAAGLVSDADAAQAYVERVPTHLVRAAG